MKSSRQVDWKATRIGGHPYAHSTDVFSRLEAEDNAPPRYAIDDVLTGFPEPEPTERRDRVEGRNRSYGRMAGGFIRGVAMDSLSVAMDSLEELPFERISEESDAKLGRIADCLRARLQGTTLNRIQSGYLDRLRKYLTGKTCIEDCSVLTLTALLRGLATT